MALINAHNNLTALRWFAACLVLYGHAFVFLGLPVEFFMYLLLALLGFLGTRFQNQKWGKGLTAASTLAFMLLVALWALPSTEALVVFRTDLRQIPLCGVYFIVGACLFQFNAVKYFSLSNVVVAVVAWLCLGRQPQLFAIASWVVFLCGVGLWPVPTRMAQPMAFTGLFLRYLHLRLPCAANLGVFLARNASEYLPFKHLGDHSRIGGHLVAFC